MTTPMTHVDCLDRMTLPRMTLPIIAPLVAESERGEGRSEPMAEMVEELRWQRKT